MSKAVFLDRDGTLIVDQGYLCDPDRITLIEGVIPALTRIQQAGFLLGIVTNQSTIGRRLRTSMHVEEVNARVQAMFSRHGVDIGAVCYCPHVPEDACSCRKPKPGLLLAAADLLGVDIRQSAMIGDNYSDIEAGEAARCPVNVLLAPTPHPGILVASDIGQAADLVLEKLSGRSIS